MMLCCADSSIIMTIRPRLSPAARQVRAAIGEYYFDPINLQHRTSNQEVNALTKRLVLWPNRGQRLNNNQGTGKQTSLQFRESNKGGVNL